MYLKIKNISVINANLFSCPYTAGFSLAAFKGLTDKLSLNISKSVNDTIYFKAFGIIVTKVETKIQEPIQRDTSTGTVSKNKYSLPAMLQHRYFDFTIDLVLETDDFHEDLLVLLANEINKCKIQGGLITNVISIDNISRFFNLYDEELVYKTYPLGYFITDASEEIKDNLDFIEQVSEKLLESNYMLISNGYRILENSEYVRHIENQEELKSLYVEPNIILAKVLPIHEFKKDKNKLKNFMFSNYKKDNYLIVHA